MNEAGYIRSVHRHVLESIHKWKIADRFHAGVPDCWYSGLLGSLWIEYKYLKKCPKLKHTPRLSEQQIDWLNERFDEGRNVAVVVGTPEGAIIYQNKTWNAAQKIAQLFNPREVANWIASQVFA